MSSGNDWPYADMIRYQHRRRSGAMLNILTLVSRRVLAEAHNLAQNNQHQFAVVLAQAACELHTEEALNNLMRARGTEFLSEVVMKLLGNTISLDDPASTEFTSR